MDFPMFTTDPCNEPFGATIDAQYMRDIG